MFDIVCAVKNKGKFRKIGKELGFEKIFFLESFEKASSKTSSMADAVLIEANSPRELTRKVTKAKDRYKATIVLGSSDDVNRSALENKQIDVLLSPEHVRKRDFTHYRNSGLNQVLCKIAAKNNKAIGIDFNDIKKAKGKEKALKLGRIMQNIKLCLKYNVKMLLASFSAKPADMVYALDLLSFARAISMSPRQAKDSLENMGKIIERK